MQSSPNTPHNTDLNTRSHVVAPKFFYNEILQWNYLRNEFNFWNVHGIMNTLGLLQSK